VTKLGTSTGCARYRCQNHRQSQFIATPRSPSPASTRACGMIPPPISVKFLSYMSETTQFTMCFTAVFDGKSFQ
jgi:hypothetical protein